MRADLHVHSHRSVDGRSSLSELSGRAAALGLSAIAVCDHDRCTDVSGDYPVLLIPSVEITTEKGHILGLFLDSPIEKDFFDTLPSSLSAIEKIHAHGGLAVLAHPFAPQKMTEQEIAALPLDGIECENARSAASSPLHNRKAHALAESLKLPATGGSDAHCDKELGGCITEFDCEPSLAEMKNALRNGLSKPVFVHACRKKYKGLSQWQKHKKSPLKARLWAFFYLHYCIAADLFTRR